jgi:antitoxin FitA
MLSLIRTDANPQLTHPPKNAIIGINGSMGFGNMASLHVRRLDDEIVARLKRRAARHGRSAEAEHREILRQALEAETEASFDELAGELRKLLADRHHTPAEVLQREGRDER